MASVKHLVSKTNSGQAMLVIDLRAFGDPALSAGVVADLAALAADLGIAPLS